jgi:hypothetical protein
MPHIPDDVDTLAPRGWPWLRLHLRRDLVDEAQGRLSCCWARCLLHLRGDLADGALCRWAWWLLHLRGDLADEAQRLARCGWPRGRQRLRDGRGALGRGGVVSAASQSSWTRRRRGTAEASAATASQAPWIWSCATRTVEEGSPGGSLTL